MELMCQFMNRNIQNLMLRGTELEIDLALKQAEIDRLTAEIAELKKPAVEAVPDDSVSAAS